MIVVNGKSYSSLDEMPPEVRQEYEQAMGLLADKNQDGMPDVFAGMLGTDSTNAQPSTVMGSSQFIVDGKVYSSVDELPLDARQKYEQAMAKMGSALGSLLSDANQNGLPDVFDGMFATQPTPSRPLFDTTPADSNDAAPNQRGTLIFAGIVIVALLVGLVVLGASVVLPQIR